MIQDEGGLATQFDAWARALGTHKIAARLGVVGELEQRDMFETPA